MNKRPVLLVVPFLLAGCSNPINSSSASSISSTDCSVEDGFTMLTNMYKMGCESRKMLITNTLVDPIPESVVLASEIVFDGNKLQTTTKSNANETKEFLLYAKGYLEYLPDLNKTDYFQSLDGETYSYARSDGNLIPDRSRYTTVIDKVLEMTYRYDNGLYYFPDFNVEASEVDGAISYSNIVLKGRTNGIELQYTSTVQDIVFHYKTYYGSFGQTNIVMPEIPN